MASTASTTSNKQRFLETYEQEHEKTMRVLRAYPADKAEFKPSERCKPARELAWMFALERGLGTSVLNDAFAKGAPSGGGGKLPDAPPSWDAVMDAAEKTHKDFVDFVRSMPEDKLDETVKFFTGPKTLGDVRRLDFLWFLLHDEIHHRGQFSIYLRAAGGKVPSIYGPSEHEPWF
jgi:uncharacterized damage-inducible protein DinB